MAGGRLRPYVGGGYNRLEPRFQVNFTNQFGAVDSTRVEVNLNRGVVFGGATWQLTERLGVAAEVYSAPSTATWMAWRSATWARRSSDPFPAIPRAIKE